MQRVPVGVFNTQCYTEHGIAISSHPSVCTCVTLRYRGHIGRSTPKIISQLVSLVCSLSADPNITDLLQGDHAEIPCGAGIG